VLGSIGQGNSNSLDYLIEEEFATLSRNRDLILPLGFCFVRGIVRPL
jgi:hypothetical protein